MGELMNENIFCAESGFCTVAAYGDEGRAGRPHSASWMKALPLVLLAVILGGCGNMFGGKEHGGASAEYAIKGTFLADGAVPGIYSADCSGAGAERSAVAVYPEAGAMSYAVKAVSVTEPSSVYTAEVSGNSFSVKLTEGAWTVTAEGFSSGKLVMRGTASASVSAERPVADGITVELSPVSEGSGSVSLALNAGDTSGIASVDAELTASGKTDPLCSERLEFQNGHAEFRKTDVPSGAYTLRLNFYSSEDASGNKILLYAAEEKVNVFDNLVTDTWQGSSAYFTDDGKFTVTKELVDRFSMTTFFVQGGDGTYSPVSAASDSNRGTYFAPLATVQAAVDRIGQLNDGATEYKIYVDGTVTDSSDGSYTAGNNYSLINIAPASAMKIALAAWKTGARIDAGRDSSKTGRVLYAGGTGLSLTLSGLEFTGGYAYISGDGGKGGGIFVASGAEVLIDGCKITGNTSKNSGGGIYSKGNLTVTGGTEISGNRSASSGGGICFADGTLSVRGEAQSHVVISGNTAESDGGGGISAAETGIKLSFVDFTGNSAGTKGGGMAVNGGKDIAEFRDVSFTGNSAEDGGGAHFQNSCFTGGFASTSVTVRENKAGSAGAGLFISSGGDYTSLSFDGIEVSGNTAKNPGDQIKGTGIYIEKGEKNCTLALDGASEIDGIYTACKEESGKKVYPSLKIGADFAAVLPIRVVLDKNPADADIAAPTVILQPSDGTLSWTDCSGFLIDNTAPGGTRLWCIKPSSDGKSGILALSGAAVTAGYSQPEYTLTLSPALFSSAKTDNKISLAVTESDGNAVTPDSVEFALYQNKNKVAVLQGGLLPSWIPAGNYTVIAAAKIGGYSYDVEKNIIISENIAISFLTSAPSASDFPKITASSSQELVTLCSWVNSGSDFEGITITLVDDIDLTDCTDWQPIGFVSESENRPFKGTFDGQGHSLSFDIGNIDSSNRFRKIGVFYKNDGVIENLVISQYLQDGKTLIIYGNSSQYAYSNAGGGICIENSGIVRNCINKSSIIASTFSDIGGICMSNAETGIIENCLFSGSITMNAKCSNGGDNQKSAGICPRNNGIIKNCVSNGSITTEAETDQNLPDAILNNISGAISVYTEGFIENCYWLKNNIKSGSSSKNRIAYTKSTYKKLTCIPDPSRITGCGYFETDSPSASVTAGTTSECKSAQTLAYSGTLIQMLNAYVSASSDSGLKKWKADSSGNLTLDF